MKTSSAVSVIDDDGTNDAQGPLLVLGGAVSLLLGAGVIRRLVVQNADTTRLAGAPVRAHQFVLICLRRSYA